MLGYDSYGQGSGSEPTDMPRFHQVLSPAADGQGMSLDPKLLKMLREERVRDRPVVVLTVIGPRNEEKMRLLDAVQKAIAEGADRSRMAPGSARSTFSSTSSTELPMETEELNAAAPREPRQWHGMEFGERSSGTDLSGRPTAVEPFKQPTGTEASEPSGPAGAVAWSELMPINLSDGTNAALLLLDAWGPFEETCPLPLRASVLLFSALVSSTLVVHTSARRPVQPLDDLQLLGRLADAAQEVRHCTPLQQLVLLMGDWDGPAPPGRQTDFKPLFGWMEAGPDAKRALDVMMDATDLYNEGDAFLFLIAGQICGDGNKTDCVRMLAGMRTAKRFVDTNVTAGEFADYLDSLNRALRAARCDADSLLHALAEANQALAVEANKAIYNKKIKELEKKWLPGPVSEQELRGAHDRAAHEALIAFTMHKKMDSEKMDSEKSKRQLQSWLDKQYNDKWRAIQDNAKQFEEKTSEADCIYVDQYEAQMKAALENSPQMTIAELIKHHQECKGSIMSELHGVQNTRYSLTPRLIEISDKLEGSFRQFASQLDQTKQREEETKAKKSLVASVEETAILLYKNIMRAVRSDQISTIHGRVQECAILKFDSSTEMLEENQRSDAHKRLKKATDAFRDQLLREMQNHASSAEQHMSVSHYQPSAYRGRERPREQWEVADEAHAYHERQTSGSSGVFSRAWNYIRK